MPPLKEGGLSTPSVKEGIPVALTQVLEKATTLPPLPGETPKLPSVSDSSPVQSREASNGSKEQVSDAKSVGNIVAQGRGAVAIHERRVINDKILMTGNKGQSIDISAGPAPLAALSDRQAALSPSGVIPTTSVADGVALAANVAGTAANSTDGIALAANVADTAAKSTDGVALAANVAGTAANSTDVVALAANVAGTAANSTDGIALAANVAGTAAKSTDGAALAANVAGTAAKSTDGATLAANVAGTAAKSTDGATLAVNVVGVASDPGILPVVRLPDPRLEPRQDDTVSTVAVVQGSEMKGNDATDAQSTGIVGGREAGHVSNSPETLTSALDRIATEKSVKTLPEGGETN